ncbi:MAG: hypothetical protein J7K04_04895, partial [Spirochaetales bacterium]|nr:hypothetical protein [Spirochaetales bacterium]
MSYKNNGLFSSIFLENFNERLKNIDESVKGQADGRKETLKSSKKLSDSLLYLGFYAKEAEGFRDSFLLFSDYNFSEKIGALSKNPHTLIRLLKHERINWGMTVNNGRWSLYSLKSSKPHENSLSFDFFKVLDNEEDYLLFDSFFFSENWYYREIDGKRKNQLDNLLKESEESVSVLVNGLKDSVEDVLKNIAYGLIENEETDTFTEEKRNAIFQSAVKIFYRIIFFLYAESRELLPSVPNENYPDISIFSLVKKSHDSRDENFNREGYDLWNNFDALCRWTHDGNEEYGIIAYNGGLFSYEKGDYLNDKKIKNKYFAQAIYKLSYLNLENKEIRIPYKDLSVRHLGELYEDILEYNLYLAETTLYKRVEKDKKVYYLTREQIGDPKKTDEEIKKGSLYISESRFERKSSGSFYTDERLVEYIVKSSVIKLLDERLSAFMPYLKELRENVRNAPTESDKKSRINFLKDELSKFIENKILSIKVIDPAMGSGHFLVHAANRIADFIVELIDSIDEIEDFNKDTNYWRREVTKNCLYGVDIKGTAVELAKLSLWLNSFSKDHKLTFLDHHLRCGNSLIGIIRLSELAKMPHLGKVNNGEYLFPIWDLEDYLKNAGIELDNIESYSEKETDLQWEAYSQYRKKIEKLNKIADLYTAALMEKKIDPSLYINAYNYILNGGTDRQDNNEGTSSFIKVSFKLARKNNFFHWELEYPNIFRGGGFDIIVGNPPWDIIQASSVEFFIQYDPMFRKLAKQEALKK